MLATFAIAKVTLVRVDRVIQGQVEQLTMDPVGLLTTGLAVPATLGQVDQDIQALAAQSMTAQVGRNILAQVEQHTTDLVDLHTMDQVAPVTAGQVVLVTQGPEAMELAVQAFASRKPQSQMG